MSALSWFGLYVNYPSRVKLSERNIAYWQRVMRLKRAKPRRKRK